MAISKLSSGTQSQLREAIGQRESSGDISVVNTLGYVGKFQFGASALETNGYITPGASLGGNSVLNNPSVWTGKNGATNLSAFLESESIQNTAFDNNVAFNLRQGKSLGALTSASSEADIAAFAAAAHISGAGGASELFNNGVVSYDGYDTSNDEYANIGRNAAKASSAPNNPPSNTASTSATLSADTLANAKKTDTIAPAASTEPGVQNKQRFANASIDPAEESESLAILNNKGKISPEDATVFNSTWEPKPNPFKAFATMTYSISLYILSNPEYRELMRSGTKSVEGLTLFMQSGGISAKPGTANTHNFGAKRAENFPLDYYIDHIQFEGLVSGSATQAPHNVFTMKFTITEPAGLTFLENLQGLVRDFTKNTTENINYVAQNYLMVVRFYGYDAEGNQISASDLETSETLSDRQAVSEKFIPFMFTKASFRLDSNKIDYSCEAVCPNSNAPLDFVHGGVPANTKVQGRTLRDVLVGNHPTNKSGNKNIYGLAEALNARQDYLYDKKLIKEKDLYEIKFDETDTMVKIDPDKITVIKPGTQNLNATPIHKVDDPARDDPDVAALTNQRRFESNAGKKITRVIDTIMRNSTFITDQYDKATDENSGKLIPKDRQNLTWFKIRTQVEQLEKDDIRNVYATKITYHISAFKVDSVSIHNFENNKCFNIHKKFDYWFTGENTEVIKFSQDYNYLYYTAFGTADKPQDPNRKTHDARTIQTLHPMEATASYTENGELGSNDPSAAAASELYSPGDQAVVEIDIVGDPDFIAQSELFYSPEQNIGGPFNHKPFLDDGSINYDVSEVYFAINFNTITDYDLYTGLADVKAGNTGYDLATGQPGLSQHSFIYRANTITTELTGGAFTQRLSGTLMFIPEGCTFGAPNDVQREENNKTTAAEMSGMNTANSKTAVISSPVATKPLQNTTLPTEAEENLTTVTASPVGVDPVDLTENVSAAFSSAANVVKDVTAPISNVAASLFDGAGRFINNAVTVVEDTGDDIKQAFNGIEISDDGADRFLNGDDN